MQLTFLEVGDTHPCNNLATSHTADITTLEEFYAALCGFAKLNCQLLKGSLKREVTKENWKDAYTNYSELQWLCIESPSLPSVLKNTSHIRQADRYFVRINDQLPVHAADAYVRTLKNASTPDTIVCITDGADIDMHIAENDTLIIPKDLLTELHALPQPTPPQPTIKYLVFNHLQTDTYYAGDVDIEARTQNLHAVSSKAKVKDFLQLRDDALTGPVPEWNMTFDPGSTTFIDMEEQYINTFMPSTYLLTAKKLDIATIPTMIDTVINSITADDAESKQHFLNWLAFKFQTRRKTNTAWIFTGIEGTGKGILFNQILAPLFGDDHCRLFMRENMEEMFNAYDEKAILIGIDEARINNDRQGEKLLNKLKTKITEPTIELRKMRTNSFKVKNHCDYVFFSNYRDAMHLTITDRRYNVAPHQETPLPRPTQAQFESIAGELQDFANYLWTFDVCEDTAHAPLDNEAKKLMSHNSASPHEHFFRALKTGDVRYFMECVENPHPTQQFLRAQVQDIIRYTVTNIKDDATFVSTSDLVTLYNIARGKDATTTRDMNVYLNHNGFSARVRQPTYMRPKKHTRPRGQKVAITLTDTEKASILKDLDTNTADAHIAPFKRSSDADNNN